MERKDVDLWERCCEGNRRISSQDKRRRKAYLEHNAANVVDALGDGVAGSRHRHGPFR